MLCSFSKKETTQMFAANSVLLVMDGLPSSPGPGSSTLSTDNMCFISHHTCLNTGTSLHLLTHGLAEASVLPDAFLFKLCSNIFFKSSSVSILLSEIQPHFQLLRLHHLFIHLFFFNVVHMSAHEDKSCKLELGG